MIARSLAAVLLATLLAACGRQATTPDPAQAPEPAPAPAAQPAAGAGQFGPTERAFVELTIATDDQAVALLDLGAGHATDPALRALAAELAAARRAELAQLHAILAGAALTYVNQHAGHDMPGMPTSTEIATLAGLGAGFDPEFTRLLRAHLEESATVIRGALESVDHKETRAIVERMATERAASLARLDQTH
jgi:uncharacterized protein (DUF305 family)